MSATPASTLADFEQLTAELQRQLAECRAERDETREYQTAISDVLKVISRSTADVQPVLDALVETAVRLCDSDTAAITIREGEVYRYVASSFSASDPSIGRSSASGPLSPVAAASPDGWRSKAGSFISKTSAQTPTTRSPRFIRAGRRTLLGVPLLSAEEIAALEEPYVPHAVVGFV